MIRGAKGEFLDPLTGEVDWLVIPQAAAAALPRRTTSPAGTIHRCTSTSNRHHERPTPAARSERQPGLPGIPIKDYAGGPFIGVRPPRMANRS